MFLLLLVILGWYCRLRRHVILNFGGVLENHLLHIFMGMGGHLGFEAANSSKMDSSEEEEEDVPTHHNINCVIAKDEFELLEQYKRKKCCTVLDRSKSNILWSKDETGKTWEILAGPVISREGDLPSGKNPADYSDCRGRFEGLRFFEDHFKMFPTIWLLMLIKVALENVKVGCEQLFSLLGYISAPCCTHLGVCTYESIALLVVILTKVYIDVKWVTKEYLRWCKTETWKKENIMNALKFWNLECIIDAEL